MNDPRLWSHGRFFSYALVLSALFFLAPIAGLQSHTYVLAGTHSGGYLAQYFGLVYLLLYVIFTCIVPVMVIPGCLLWLGGRMTRSTAAQTESAPTPEPEGPEPLS